MDKKFDAQVLLDSLAQGILIFDSAGKLVGDNEAARTMLGKDLDMIRKEGWTAAAVLFNTKVTDPSATVDAARDKAQSTAKPVRFSTFRSGEHIPCWASAVKGDDNSSYTMITLETADWTVLTEVMEKFSEEVREAVESTQGHVELINQTFKRQKAGDSVETITKRISGFVRLIDVHMHRVGRLVSMLERLEKLRVGKLQTNMREHSRKINVTDFMEDFMEGLDETKLLDPETTEQDYRGRITLKVDNNLMAQGSPSHLTVILQDVLRNAIMYSMKATPVKITAYPAAQNESIQFDVVDEGYGVRAKEWERVFAPFQRARQPQIISEFGYGLSLYLCKHEVEAMNGRMWFKSEEGVGSTFSFTLPVWREESSSVSKSS